MTSRILLVNPRITSRHKARFPLSLLALAADLGEQCEARIVDGNVERDGVASVLGALDAQTFDAVGLSVMGGPQVRTAIDISRAVREKFSAMPIAWGGYFPTLYPDATMRADYVDYAVRGQGERIFPALIDALHQNSNSDSKPRVIGGARRAADRSYRGYDAGAGTYFDDGCRRRTQPQTAASSMLSSIAGLSWKNDCGVVHNAERRFTPVLPAARLPYELLGDPRRYLVPSFMGRRTAAHQAALGCRFRCTFCGVAALFRGATALPSAERLARDLGFLKTRLGADSIQFYDHNFFDREVDMVPLLEVLAKLQLPWWCYARADALLNLSDKSWSLVRRSRLRMAYIGAESPSDALLKDVRKGTRAEQTLAVTELCARQGVVPELSFMVAPPEDPEGETERTFEFIREIKRINPAAEIIVYIYTPVPVRGAGATPPLRDAAGQPVTFPATPDEWTQRRWVDYACHADAPWMTPRLRQRIRDFVTVLGCRFPTVQDERTPTWAKSALRGLAAWRYRYKKYDRPWELGFSKRLIRLSTPQTTSL